MAGPGRIVGAGDISKLLAHTDRRIRKGISDGVIEAAAIGAEIVAKDAPVDTGRLKQSVVMRKRGPSGGPEIIAQAPYAGPVETGTKPHWAPLRPLIGWVRRKVRAEAKRLGLRTPGRVGLYRGRTAAAWRAYNRRSALRQGYVDGIIETARMVQRAIARRGTRPTWFMRNNLPRLEQVLRTCMREAKTRTIASLNGGRGP